MTAYYDISRGEKKPKRFCDNCGKLDADPTVCWHEKDFDLCLQCFEAIKNPPLMIDDRFHAMMLAKGGYNDEAENPLEATVCSSGNEGTFDGSLD